MINLIYLFNSLLIHVISSMVVGISEFLLCNSGIRIVEKPKVEPNVIRTRFFAPTAQHCGKASRYFEIGARLAPKSPFNSTGVIFFPLLKICSSKIDLITIFFLSIKIFNYYWERYVYKLYNTLIKGGKTCQFYL